MKILMVAPLFAPYSGVGAARMTSLARFLSKKHHVSVVTYDESFYNKAKHEVLCAPEVKNIKRITFTPVKSVDRYKNRKKNYVILQDVLSEELNGNTYDVIIVTQGPVFTQSVIRRISRKYHIPYIADFRDLDILDNYIVKGSRKTTSLYEFRKLIHKQIFKAEEKRFSREAYSITFANPAHLNFLKRTYKIEKSKLKVVLNGYDDERISNIVLPGIDPNRNEYIIGIFGKFYFYDHFRAPRMLRILKTVVDRYPNVVIWHAGECDANMDKAVQEAGLSNEQYRNLGMLNYEDGMKMMSQANLLADLIVHPNSLGTKIFDYIYLNRPVISMAPDGIAFKDFFNHYENICITDDDKDIIEFISRMIEEKIAVLDKNCNTEQYARSNSNKLFEELLKEAAESGK